MSIYSHADRKSYFSNFRYYFKIKFIYINNFRSKTGIVTCDADFNFKDMDETLFNSFGIGLDLNMFISIPVTDKYYLYPSIMGHTDFMSYQVTLPGKQSLFALYQDSKYDFFGVRVRDNVCFQKIIDYFSSIVKISKTVDLKSYSTVPNKAYIFSNLYVV